MNNFKVAVVIPTLNEERFIEGCLQSVMKQTFPFEEMDVMVVDGGSKDKTRDIVNSISEKHPNVRLLPNPGKIQSIAFNIGVKESTAPYIVRLDAHASYCKEYIETCVKHLMEDPTVGNSGGVWDIQPQRPELVPEASAILNQVKFGIGGASYRVGAAEGYADEVPFGSYPREVIDEVGGMREDLARGEDNEFYSRIKKAGYKIYLDPKAVITYYARDTFKGNMKQMYANGLSIGKLLFIDHESVGLRHLVPLAFVISLIGSLILGCIWTPLFGLFGLALGTYLLADIAATISACRKFGWKYLLVLLLLFFLVHVSYGWGTIIGILKR
ncbi:MAG: glycosyltransferase family 2 protein [Prevotellaceae bacterium]|nr:glycosyltransferase family 2 protein [Prevotellaceae bacterium]